MHAVLLLLVIWGFILSVILVVLGITGRTRLVVSLGVGTVLSDVPHHTWITWRTVGWI